MPLYEYECGACGKRFELIRRHSDPAVDVCTLCGKGPVRRLMSSPAIQFKGSGWYITDYARKAKSEKTSGDKGGEGKSEGASDAKSDGGAKSDGTAKSDAGKSDAGKSDTPAKPATETKS
jgi:putative FmdB family regulatory protein